MDELDRNPVRDSLTHAVEDYLKTIYNLTAASGRASTNQIAERMGVKPASVTSMIQKLAATQPPLLEYRKHHGVVLTGEGEKVALEIIRHHRLLEMFLHQTLGYGWDEVHEEADRLEHVISEELEERIATTLGDPRHDPHGDPIPTRDLYLPRSTTTSLDELRPGQRAVIQRVRDEDRELLRYLSDLGLVPEARLEILSFSLFDGNLNLQVAGRADPVILGPNVTRQVYVEIL
jgi:DtxR family Mn-dependent transcriptional regulator